MDKDDEKVLLLLLNRCVSLTNLVLPSGSSVLYSKIDGGSISIHIYGRTNDAHIRIVNNAICVYDQYTDNNGTGRTPRFQSLLDDPDSLSSNFELRVLAAMLYDKRSP